MFSQSITHCSQPNVRGPNIGPLLPPKLASNPRSSPVCLACHLIPRCTVKCCRCCSVAHTAAVKDSQVCGPKLGPFSGPNSGPFFVGRGASCCELHTRFLHILAQIWVQNMDQVGRGAAQNRVRNLDPDLVQQLGVKKHKRPIGGIAFVGARH